MKYFMKIFAENEDKYHTWILGIRVLCNEQFYFWEPFIFKNIVLCYNVYDCNCMIIIRVVSILYPLTILIFFWYAKITKFGSVLFNQIKKCPTLTRIEETLIQIMNGWIIKHWLSKTNYYDNHHFVNISSEIEMISWLRFQGKRLFLFLTIKNH